MHPHDAHEWDAGTEASLRAWLANDKVVAVGECGLDYFMGRDSFKKQQHEVFAAQCQLAVELGKPVVVHSREAFADTLAVLRDHGIGKRVPGVIHFFTAPRAEGEAFLDLGLHLSITGVVTLASAKDLPESVRAFPLERLISIILRSFISS